MDILNVSGMEDSYGKNTQTAGRQFVVDGQDEELGFTDLFYGRLGRFTDTECILFFLFVSYFPR